MDYSKLTDRELSIEVARRMSRHHIENIGTLPIRRTLPLLARARRYFCVSADRVGYAPVELDDLLRRLVGENETVNNSL